MSLKKLINKILQSESLMYIFFGGCTTVVNYVTFELVLLLGIEYKVSNIIAFIVSIIFAYITNKIYVFKSKTSTLVQILRELFLFCISRLGTFIIEIGLLIVLVDYIAMNVHLSKIIVTIIVIILNYILSKYLIFSKKKGAKKYETIR